MKKNYTLLLLAACWVTLAAAQAAEYTPLLCEGKTWHMHHEALFAPEDGIFDFDYFIAGDTIIAGLPCKKLYSHNVYNSGTTDYVLALYETDKKVYCFPAGSVEKYLLYDFGASKGDEIFVAGNTNSKPLYVTMYVNENKSINIRGTEHQALNVMRLDIPKDDTAWASGWWIDGVGSEEGPLNTWIFKAPGNYDNLVSCEVNGTVIYTASDLLLLKEKYMPLLREGVKWVNLETVYSQEGEEYSEYDLFYVVEVKGDTVIDGITYKKCYRYPRMTWDKPLIDCSTTEPIAILREEAPKVYIRSSKDSYYGLGEERFWGDIFINIDYGEEAVLYDFSDQGRFQPIGTAEVAGQPCQTFKFKDEPGLAGVFVEGVGYDSSIDGDLLFPGYMGPYTAGVKYSSIGLHHVEDADGNIIYKGANYGKCARLDMDWNTKLDVEDVNAVINLILKESKPSQYGRSADANGDGRVDVEDVNALINAILTPAK